MLALSRNLLENNCMTLRDVASQRESKWPTNWSRQKSCQKDKSVNVHSLFRTNMIIILLRTEWSFQSNIIEKRIRFYMQMSFYSVSNQNYFQEMKVFILTIFTILFSSTVYLVSLIVRSTNSYGDPEINNLRTYMTELLNVLY